MKNTWIKCRDRLPDIDPDINCGKFMTCGYYIPDKNTDEEELKLWSSHLWFHNGKWALLMNEEKQVVTHWLEYAPEPSEDEMLEEMRLNGHYPPRT